MNEIHTHIKIKNRYLKKILFIWLIHDEILSFYFWATCFEKPQHKKPNVDRNVCGCLTINRSNYNLHYEEKKVTSKD